MRKRQLCPHSLARLLASFQKLLTNKILVNIYITTCKNIPMSQYYPPEGWLSKISAASTQYTLTYAIVHLITVFFQVVLDAALEKVQLGLELLRKAKHAVLTPGQVGVVAQETQPRGEINHYSQHPKWNLWSVVKQLCMSMCVSLMIYCEALHLLFPFVEWLVWKWVLWLTLQPSVLGKVCCSHPSDHRCNSLLHPKPSSARPEEAESWPLALHSQTERRALPMQSGGQVITKNDANHVNYVTWYAISFYIKQPKYCWNKNNERKSEDSVTCDRITFRIH